METGIQGENIEKKVNVLGPLRKVWSFSWDELKTKSEQLVKG